MGSWVVYSHSRPSSPLRLFAFSHAGGGSAAFRSWADRLGEDIELGYVQLPGRESRLRERPFASIPELIPPLTDAIVSQLDRTFAFYGHSLGGRIAFEVARELRRRQMPEPCHLFVAASHAPQMPWPHPFIHHLETSSFLKELQHRYGGIPQQVIEDVEMRDLLVPALRADVAMIETCSYTAEAPLACGITAFGGFQDAMTAQSALASWRQQTSGEFRLRMTMGDHFFPNLTQTMLPESIATELLDFVKANKVRAREHTPYSKIG